MDWLLVDVDDPENGRIYALWPQSFQEQLKRHPTVIAKVREKAVATGDSALLAELDTLENEE